MLAIWNEYLVYRQCTRYTLGGHCLIEIVKDRFLNPYN